MPSVDAHASHQLVSQVSVQCIKGSGRLLGALCVGVRGGPVTQSTTNLITVSLLPVAILMIGYALTTFLLRSIYLQRKQVTVAIAATPYHLASWMRMLNPINPHYLDEHSTTESSVGVANGLLRMLCVLADGLLHGLDWPHNPVLSCHCCALAHYNSCFCGCFQLPQSLSAYWEKELQGTAA